MRRRLVLLAAMGLSLAFPALAAPLSERHKVVLYFPIWSADFDTDAGKVIDSAAKWASEHPGVPLDVAGYASITGSRRANALLSDLRAQVVKDRLVAKGVPARLITILPKGGTRSIDNPLESRRVEIYIDPR